MKRKSGYYFIIIKELGGRDTSKSWIIGCYDAEDKDWMLPGIAVVFKDSDFSEIKEEPILPPK